MKLREAVDLYYHSPEGLALTEYQATSSGSRANFVTMSQTPAFRHTESLDSSHVDEVLDEVSRSIKVIEHGGSGFEIGVANNSVDSDEYMLHWASYSSALSTNPGNDYEFAAQVVRYPKYKHLYIGAWAIGGTSPLLPYDAAYSAANGRFTQERNGKTHTIQSIRNLHAALTKEKISVTRIMGTDSAGGHYARALALDMEPGQLSHAFFSETSGFVDLTKRQITLGMLYTELIRNAKQNKQISPDPEQIDGLKIARAKAALAQYADSPERQAVLAHRTKPIAKARSIVSTMNALRRGPTEHDNPLVADNNPLLERHPNAKLTYALAEHDPLYLDPETCHAAAKQFLASLAIANMPVRALIVPGMSHAYNTFFPSLYHSVKRYAVEL